MDAGGKDYRPPRAGHAGGLTAHQKSRSRPNLRMKAWRSFGFADLRMARAEKFPFIAPPAMYIQSTISFLTNETVSPRFNVMSDCRVLLICPMNRSSTCAKGWIQKNSTPLFASRAILTEKLVMVGRGCLARARNCGRLFRA